MVIWLSLIPTRGKWKLCHHCYESSRVRNGKVNWIFVEREIFRSFVSSFSRYDGKYICHSDVVLVYSNIGMTIPLMATSDT